MKYRRDEPQPGEWQYDEQGRKFRKVGSSIEYAMKIHTSGGDVYAAELEDHNRRIREQKEEYYKKQREAVAAMPQAECPFKIARGGLHTKCDPDCAFFNDAACMIASNKKPSKDTEGKYCPVCRICRTSCAMYDGGCKLACLFMGMTPGKEE